MVEHHGRLVGILLQVELQAVAVLGGIGAVGTAVLVHVVVAFHVAVQHGLVYTAVVAVCALKGLGAIMVAEVVLQVVLVLSGISSICCVGCCNVNGIEAVNMPNFVF